MIMKKKVKQSTPKKDSIFLDNDKPNYHVQPIAETDNTGQNVEK